MSEMLALIWSNNENRLVYQAMPDNAYTRLQSAICISLFTDAQSDNLAPNAENGGYWGDRVYQDGQSLGSELWRLRRKKLTQDVLNQVQSMAYQALNWLIDEARVTAINVEVQRRGVDTVVFVVTYTLSAGENWQSLIMEWKNGIE